MILLNEEDLKILDEIVKEVTLAMQLEDFVLKEDLYELIESKLQTLFQKLPPNHPLLETVENISYTYEDLRESIETSEIFTPELLELIKLNEELSRIAESLNIEVKPKAK